jgi:hypothetical protein
MSDCLSVSTMVRAMFRRARDEHSPRLYAGAGPSPTAGLREEMLASARPDLTLRFLAEMDRKLDALLSLMQREILHSDFPLEGHVVRISAGRLVLECAQPLAPGEYLEILLLLEQYPMLVVSLLGRVEEEVPALTGPPNLAHAICVVTVEEDDREHIIRFVFAEERKRIRREKDVL